MDRPLLDRTVDVDVFLDYYYLKKELVSFCRSEGLPTSGGKPDLTDRVAHYLRTGEVLPDKTKTKKCRVPDGISECTPIEDPPVFSEKHRTFFEQRIGQSFSFNVPFQKWLRSNAGKSYGESITAYGRIISEKGRENTDIDVQFEYNRYIRDFFSDNKDRHLGDAIVCWRFKKNLPGHNRYEHSDLTALK
ncbi:MAG: SAP domain-containing protein [Candidatus Methanoplasma sp.]|jgi:hypothetical protein|nr:SAP domain-containing protein [Candidatus Methanoplasma sp.]